MCNMDMLYLYCQVATESSLLILYYFLIISSFFKNCAIRFESLLYSEYSRYCNTCKVTVQVLDGGSRYKYSTCIIQYLHLYSYRTSTCNTQYRKYSTRTVQVVYSKVICTYSTCTGTEARSSYYSNSTLYIILPCRRRHAGMK